MIKFLKYAIIAASILIAGCSSIYGGDRAIIQDRDSDYLKAKSIPPLQIPPGLSSKTIRDTYPISTIDYPEARKKISLVPPGLN